MQLLDGLSNADLVRAKLVKAKSEAERSIASDVENMEISGATAIDRGVEFEEVPQYEYVHPTGARLRRKVWRFDVGAYERCGL